ncbi:MAG: hypothetical protein GY749_15150 [Desulfobacteraceae bacterium]|nr:hypothetical protein [Desulfobacteraceae bacterium]
MYSRISAMSQARKYRTCPPPDIADNPINSRQLQQHVRICPYCSAQAMEDMGSWNDLTVNIQGFFHVPEPQNNDKALKGQLRYIRSDMGKWHEGFFYNPPLVLVLEDYDKTSDHIPAAQTYHDICLASPGDIILSNEQITAHDEFFVECWNTYTVKNNDLGPVAGQVTPEITEAVRKLEKNSDAYPPWAVMPKPLTNHDIRIYFRELEAEVSRIFSSEIM